MTKIVRVNHGQLTSPKFTYIGLSRNGEALFFLELAKSLQFDVKILTHRLDNFPSTFKIRFHNERIPGN